MKSAIAKIEKILKLTHSSEPNEARAAATMAVHLMTTHKVCISKFHDYNHDVVHSLNPVKKKVKKPKPKAKKLMYEPKEFTALMREIKKRMDDISYNKYFSKKYAKRFQTVTITRPEQEEAIRLINDVWLWQWFHKCIRTVFVNYPCQFNRWRKEILGISEFTSPRTVLTPEEAEFNINLYTHICNRKLMLSKLPKTFLKLKISKLGCQNFRVTIYADNNSVLQKHKPSKVYFPNYRKSLEFTLVKDLIPKNVYKFILDILFSVTLNWERQFKEDESLYDFEEETMIDTHIKNEKFDIKKAINF